MNKKQFDDAVSKTKMQSKIVDAAREILCDNKSVSDTATKYKISRQAADQAKKRIMSLSTDELVTMTITVDKKTADKINKLILK